MQNILYINAFQGDFLADSFLIGLKQQPNLTVYELPSNNIIYKNEQVKNSNVHGLGFTLGSILGANEQLVYKNQIDFSKIDLFIFSSILNQYGLYIQFYPYLNAKNTIILDGGDFPAIFPYKGIFRKKPYLWFLPSPHKSFLYFKREWYADKSLQSIYGKWIPSFLCKFLPTPRNLRPISFSIPSEKIIQYFPTKIKLFPKHIVDEEIAIKVIGSATKYAFNNEHDYYADLQASKFGITTKRAGWDCLRHYEIAANGAVICFKNLEEKPKNCAPHGLIDGVNCISYSNYEDLMAKIAKISDTAYLTLQKNAFSWIQENTCKVRVKKVLEEIVV